MNRRKFLLSAGGIFVPVITGLALPPILTRTRKQPIRRVAVSASYPNAVIFDGANDYVSKAANLGGIASNKTATLSLWCKPSASIDSTTTYLLAEYVPDYYNYLRRNNTKEFRFFACNSSGTGVVNITSSAHTVDGSTWYHVYCSFDLSNGANYCLYVNGASEASVGTYTNNTIGYESESAKWAIGALDTGASKFNGSIAEVWFDNSYLGAAGLSSFYSGGKAIRLGADGSLPKGGTPPLLYMKGNAAGYATNSGSGGDFSITGTLADDTTQTLQYA